MKPDFRTVEALWGQIPLYLFAIAGMLVCAWLWQSYGVEFGFQSIAHNLGLFAGFFIFVGGPVLLWRLARAKPESPIAWVRERLLSRTARHHLIVGLPMFALCVVIIPAFSSIKSMIPLFTEYTWDETFIAWDRALFFGYDPWLLLQPLLGYPVVTAIVAAIYHLWILLLYVGPLYFAFSPQVNEIIRRQFFLGYAMSWMLIGGLMATWLASVGPVFAEPLLGIDTFRAQTDYLAAANREIPIMVVPVQQMLLENFHLNERGLGSGITAMPSMHVAICALYWLAARKVSPGLGRAFFVFMIVIWIGSVHTAYHYAVDGLVSIAAMIVLWWVVKAVIRAWDRIPSPFAQPTLRTNTVPAE
ncbi:phosphatase PAP2 family protein [Altererythrobacter arenosus]|uniref:Phosphatase PAP2 family protein n=1 Tax=Altererythrobacter arenosus TaxID=3032592 RepID=A0ABY8FR40_9SPHN|nr:phosphatase PAP2 family protein [Altererythrobacter sp. CAU 1644]WFL77483.1 phosphatase PAP2 family protein [Altererythrobacter sp. CAU 1644]